jgi:hypothetical protein
MMIRAAILFALGPGVAAAECVGTTLVSCKVAGSAKRIELCLNGGNLRYRFGAPGQVELELTRGVEQVAYTPWPGIGRTMWEELTLENEGVTYQFSSYTEKPMEEGSEDDLALGTDLNVLRGDKLLVQLTCDPAQVSDLYPVGAALQERGYCLGDDGWRKAAGAGAAGNWHCQ